MISAESTEVQAIDITITQPALANFNYTFEGAEWNTVGQRMVASIQIQLCLGIAVSPGGAAARIKLASEGIPPSTLFNVFGCNYFLGIHTAVGIR